MLRFENQCDFVEIDLAGQEAADLPARGDAYLTIRVSAAGFGGHNDLWVVAPALRSFCRALIVLERDRRGEAVLESISPDELRLVVRSVDSRGHMLIEGSTGYEVQRENSRPWHSVDFGFEFDPAQLLGAASVDWVKRNAVPDDPTTGSQQGQQGLRKLKSPCGHQKIRYGFSASEWPVLIRPRLAGFEVTGDRAPSQANH